MAEGWVLGPQGSQTDDPEQLGDLMKQISNDARLNSNMFGMPEGGNGRPNHDE